MRKGARHIKIMASGGVSSPTDRLENLQFSEEELRAIVEEAKNAGVYCAAHAYTAEAVARAVRCGVRSIEHGNYADRATLRHLRDAGGFLAGPCWLTPGLTLMAVLGLRAGSFHMMNSFQVLLLITTCAATSWCPRSSRTSGLRRRACRGAWQGGC